ncbi:hypothetical protein QVD17_29637 [Tagetes erecta]|uniref:Uncharacterized protein n=1 Tax=Tagetes erecta TaxID=13708 RepID=A0AAD8JZZ1_TARER|nr:hypothetical protein QVD17_29637 [Tagetes erecta]
MENGVNHNISSDDVISKLKDDGDFDKLRIKIIRKVKENEDLRSRIVSIVKQSNAINRTGAENMKTRQLSDAIHREVGEKLNEEVSVALWEIIRSPDGMKAEITETVKSVYDKLLNPKRVEYAEPAGPVLKRSRVQEQEQEQLGFSGTVSRQNDLPVHDLLMVERGKKTGQRSLEALGNDRTRVDGNEQGDGSDDELYAPPGFG